MSSNPLQRLPLRRPLHKTSDFGPRVHPVTGEQTTHLGVDLAANEADDYVAVFDGVVYEAAPNEFGGNQVKIESPSGWRALASHLSRMDVRQGQRVRAGQTLGKCGRTGRVTGPHLHFELKTPQGVKVDPWPYLTAPLSASSSSALGTLAKLAAVAVVVGKATGKL